MFTQLATTLPNIVPSKLVKQSITMLLDVQEDSLTPAFTSGACCAIRTKLLDKEERLTHEEFDVLFS